MVSSTMAAQDQNEGAGSEIIVPTSSRITLDDHAPKVRKPYTISKQRERWTEEEHQKFIEALQLYGRAWRRIEEHVGTKTAVQIRSHAQKFFSKVVRDSNCGDASSEKPIEIPPPRPKRKPMHPYPRKLGSPTKSSNVATEKPARSASPSPSIVERESHSPTSVLSAVGSDSNTPNRTPSPVSSSNRANASPDIDEEAAGKILLSSRNGEFLKETSVEASSSSRCLKLFGKTMFVSNSHWPSTPTVVTCKAEPVDVTDGSPLVQTVSSNFMPARLLSSNYDSSCAAYSLSNTEIPLPWWKFSGVTSFSSPRVYSPTPVLPCPFHDKDKNAQKEGSSIGSSTDSVNLDGDDDKKSDIETQSLGFSLGKEAEQERGVPSRTNKTVFSQHKAISFKNNNKGFLPYKRCLADRDIQSSTISNEEINGQRLRLCL